MEGQVGRRKRNHNEDYWAINLHAIPPFIHRAGGVLLLTLGRFRLGCVVSDLRVRATRLYHKSWLQCRAERCCLRIDVCGGSAGDNPQHISGKGRSPFWNDVQHSRGPIVFCLLRIGSSAHWPLLVWMDLISPHALGFPNNGHRLRDHGDIQYLSCGESSSHCLIYPKRSREQF